MSGKSTIHLLVRVHIDRQPSEMSDYGTTPVLHRYHVQQHCATRICTHLKRGIRITGSAQILIGPVNFNEIIRNPQAYLESYRKF